MIYHTQLGIDIYHGDCLDILPALPAKSVQCCVTSPPYWQLRDYGETGQLGLEPTPEEYVEKMVDVFREVRRVLRDDGTLWIVLGDTHNSGEHGARDSTKWPKQSSNDHAPKRPPIASLKHKDLVGIPWRVAFALQANGWYLRQDIIWHKPNPMPESVTDRCTKAHEYIFLLSKSAKYHYDAEAIKEPATYAGCDRGGSTNRYEQNAAGMDNKQYDTRNKRDVWTVPTKPFTGWTRTFHQVRVELGVPGGGIEHTVSEDCPVHGCSGPQCGGHEDDLLSRTEHKHGRRVQEPSGEQPHGSPHHENAQAEHSLDCPVQSCDLPATPRSNQTSKTDLDPATSPSCTPCGKMTSRTVGTPVQHESSGQHHDMPESNTSVDDCGDSPSNQTQNHTDHSDTQRESFEALDIPSLRELGCTCSFYRKVARKTSHFATFPPDLIEPCILAGCPEGGLVLDPFHGAGTTAMVAQQNNRRYVGCEINDKYIEMSKSRFQQRSLF